MGTSASVFFSRQYLPWEVTYPQPKVCLSRWFSFSMGYVGSLKGSQSKLIWGCCFPTISSLSLVCLRKSSHVPYRDSRLTRLLQDLMLHVKDWESSYTGLKKKNMPSIIKMCWDLGICGIFSLILFSFLGLLGWQHKRQWWLPTWGCGLSHKDVMLRPQAAMRWNIPRPADYNYDETASTLRWIG